MNFDKAKVLRLMDKVSELNSDDDLREGNITLLTDYGQVVMTGDLHGNRDNFEKIKWFCNLGRVPHRHVILHELIHYNGDGGDESFGEDDSFMLLMDALEWKREFPEQVHFILGNHDIAQITNREIVKGARQSIARFNEWVSLTFVDDGREILSNLDDLLMTFPLAVKAPEGLWFSHSLPDEKAMDDFDFSIFSRDWGHKDMMPGGSVYELVWGRNHSQEQVDLLSRRLGVDFFILGHQRQEEGFKSELGRLIILASDHERGCFMPVNLGQRYKFDDLVERVRYFYHIAPPACDT